MDNREREARAAALDELVAVSEELGLYGPEPSEPDAHGPDTETPST